MLCVAVMLSVMVLGAGAAFSDQDQIENTEAVDACSALNIIGGYEDGSFHPERNIKRSEITKMICVALNGGQEPNVSTNAVPTFTDVRGTADAWAEGYIESCVAQGIVSGVGGGRFSPAGNVTGAQLAKMLLVALGYNSDNEGFTGNAWETNVNVRAAQKDLYDGLEDMDTSAAITRDNAAQMVWNAMQAYEVEYKSNLVTDENGNLTTQVVVQDKVVGDNYDKITLLADKYEAYINVGTLVSIDGKNLTISMSTSDEQDSHDKDGAFLNLNTDYSNLLGQKVKVMYTKHNNVLGVYSTGENTVVTVNQNAIDVDAGKIVIGDKSYTIDTDGVGVVQDGQPQASNWKAGEFKNVQSANVVSLIDTDQDNKIDKAYIQTVDVQKVTYVSSSQIIAGSKTYKFADDTIADGVAKDNWVVITKDLYNDNYNITIADKATGTVNATKSATNNGAAYTQYQIGDTWYNEAAANSGKDINTNVKPGVSAEYVAVNGILFYAAKTSAGADQLTDVLFVAYVGQDGLTNDQAKVMFPNGDKATITLKNAYSTTQAGAKGADIKAGQFYEYSKSGNTYELIDLAYTADFYGNFTYEGTANQLDSDAAALGNGADKIADTADVIVWTSGTNGVDYKHITGKQLKALVAGGMKVDGSTNNLNATTLGYFTSDVDGLNRASVIAVEYNGNGTLGTAFDNISSNANYGFITKDAVKLANGKIKFTVWTGKENLEVIAEKSNEAQFTAGTIVGYTSIEEQSDVSAKADGTTYVMTDAVAISSTLVDAGSITGVNSAGTKIESSTFALPSSDLSDYSTVLYVDSKAGTGLTDGKAVKANSQKVNGTTYYATNLLVYGTEVIVIDVNEIAGSTYGAYTLQDTISGLKDVQWLNTRTNDTDEGKAYEGAVMQLSFYSTSAGKLTLTGVADIESNDNDGTVVLEYAAGYNKFDSLIVLGNVTASIDGSGSSTTGNVTFGTIDMLASKNDSVTFTVSGLPTSTGNLVSSNLIRVLDSDKAVVTESAATLDVTAFGAGESQSVTITTGATGITPGTYTIEILANGAQGTATFVVGQAGIATPGTAVSGSATGVSTIGDFKIITTEAVYAKGAAVTAKVEYTGTDTTLTKGATITLTPTHLSAATTAKVTFPAGALKKGDYQTVTFAGTADGTNNAITVAGTAADTLAAAPVISNVTKGADAGKFNIQLDKAVQTGVGKATVYAPDGTNTATEFSNTGLTHVGSSLYTMDLSGNAKMVPGAKVVISGIAASASDPIADYTFYVGADYSVVAADTAFVNVVLKGTQGTDTITFKLGDGAKDQAITVANNTEVTVKVPVGTKITVTQSSTSDTYKATYTGMTSTVTSGSAISNNNAANVFEVTGAGTLTIAQ